MPIPQTPPALYGPLPVKVQTGLSGVGFLLEPDRVAPLAPGERQRRVLIDLGSNSTFHGVPGQTLYEDLEQNNLRFGVRQGTSWGEWGAQASVVVRTGGFLDPLISWWHQNIVPFQDPAFAAVAAHQVQIRLRDGATQLTDSGSAAALTSLSLSAKRSLVPGLAVRGVVKLPLAGSRHYLDSGAVDLGVGLLGETTFVPGWGAHANLNLVRAGATTVGALTGGRRWLPGSVVAVERRVSARTTLVVQAEDSAFPFTQDMPFRADRRQQMSFGAWHQSGPETLWHASFSENIYPFLVTSYTPDIQFSLGVTHRH